MPIPSSIPDTNLYLEDFYNEHELEEDIEIVPLYNNLKWQESKVVFFNTKKLSKGHERSPFDEIEKVLEDAKHLLKFENTGIEEGAKTIFQEVFTRLKNLVLIYAKVLLEQDYILDTPEIFASSDGSLILEWYNKSSSLTIKIKNDPLDIAYYYFERTLDDGQKIDANGQIPTNKYFSQIGIWFKEGASKLADRINK